MGVMQDTIESELDKLPRWTCLKLVNERLAALDVVDDELAERIVAHVFDEAELEIDDAHPAAQLAFTQQDHARAAVIYTELAEKISGMMTELAEQSSAIYLQSLKEDWPKWVGEVQLGIDGFKARLDERWFEGLSGLRMLLQMSRELGQELCDAHAASKLKRNRNRNEAILRLHNRACQVTAEIICLLENGYAEGALSRWRTLLELLVYSVLIDEGGDPLAERFLAFEAVEHKRTMDEHDRCAPLNGRAPVPDRERRSIEKAYSAVTARYDIEFTKSYGWAAGQLGLPTKGLRFNHMQELAGSAAQRIDYKLASFGVHASPQSRVTLRLFDTEACTAGASNGGLEEPGENTAHSLARLTTLLIGQPWDLDDITLGRTILRMRDEAALAFRAAARKLHRDEQELRRTMERDAQRSIRQGARTAIRLTKR